MKLTQDTIIGELVAEDYRSAQVFKNHKIDFCCQGNRSIQTVCEEKELDSTSLLKEIEAIQQENSAETTNFQSWPLDLLADYVEKKHHRYVEQQIPIIKEYLKKIVQVHGGKHPELNEIESLFNTSAGEFAMHMKKEELILFPLIRKLIATANSGKNVEGSVAGPIKKMMQEHEDEGERFRKIAKLSDDYTPPVGACNTYKVTFNLLQEFENDLHTHIHLENNILFPNSITFEKELVN